MFTLYRQFLIIQITVFKLFIFKKFYKIMNCLTPSPLIKTLTRTSGYMKAWMVISAIGSEYTALIIILNVTSIVGRFGCCLVILRIRIPKSRHISPLREGDDFLLISW